MLPIDRGLQPGPSNTNSPPRTLAISMDFKIYVGFGNPRTEIDQKKSVIVQVHHHLMDRATVALVEVTESHASG